MIGTPRNAKTRSISVPQVPIVHVFVREKRSVQVDSCHATVQDAKWTKPGEEKQVSLDVVVATGNWRDTSNIHANAARLPLLIRA